MFWDFLSNVPESVHQVTILFSNRGTPYGFRHMNGYGSHTFRWINNQGDAFYVKWHFITNSGIKNFTNDESIEMKGKNPDFSREDLFKAIEEGKEVSWDFKV